MPKAPAHAFVGRAPRVTLGNGGEWHIGEGHLGLGEITINPMRNAIAPSAEVIDRSFDSAHEEGEIHMAWQ
jgi:hypothetical protein